MNNIQQALSNAQQELGNSSDTPQADAEQLLCHVLECNRSHLYTWPEQQLSTSESAQFQVLLKRRISGEPVAYLTGSKPFWEFDLRVSSATLIPRPETELLVEQALLRITDDCSRQILDLGTGSGAIALAIALQRPASQVTAVEQSDEAIEIAQHNIHAHNLEQIVLLQGDWFSPLHNQKFDLIVSNPPYIAEHDPHLEQGDVRHEPRAALVSGKDGLDAIRYIIAHAGQYLHADGWLLLEHGYNQQMPVKELFLQQGFEEIGQYNDLSGHVRVSCGRWPKQNQG